MKEKANNYLGLITVVFITALLCCYRDLFYPDVMMERCSYIFDQYNTSGVVWTFWKMVSEVTRVLALITSIAGMLAIVCSIRKSTAFKKVFWFSIVSYILNVIWLLSLTVAEKQESVLRFFVKFFSGVCQVEYNPNTELSMAFEKLTYFGDRVFLLLAMSLLVAFSIVWAKKKGTMEASSYSSYSYGKISLYMIMAGVLHLIFNLCTESHFLYSLLGVPKSRWEYFGGVEGTKAGFGFFFYVPVALIVAVGLILILHNRLSKRKLTAIGSGLLIANIIIVLAGIFSQMKENTEYAKKAGSVYYSLSIKKAMVTECFGLFIFELIVLVCLVDLISEERSFLQSMAILICILIGSMGVMRFSGQVDAFGLILGLGSLVIYLIFVLVKFFAGKYRPMRA